MRVTMALFQHSNGNEYVVIITDDADTSEHAEPGYDVRATWTMDVSDALIMRFPTDRPMRMRAD